MKTDHEPEVRAYSQAEIDALGADGKAYKNGDGHFSFPVDSIADLKRAIRAVGRASEEERNGVRKFLAKRAKALGQADLVPDSWNADGSISEAKGGCWTEEQRDTANDVFAALDGAVSDALAGQFSAWCVWVLDWYGSADDEQNPYMVVYHAGGYEDGALYQCPFSYDADQKVVLDIEQAEKVRPSTTYIPRSARAAADPCAGCGGSGTEDDSVCGACHGQGVARAARPAGALTPNTLEWRRSKAPRRGQTEHRTFKLDSVELREEGDGDQLSLSGYASVTDTPYSVGPYVETIAHGAFKRTLGVEGLDVTLLVNHSDLPIARTTNGTLRLSEDSHGLRVEADLDPADPDVQRIEPKLRSGLLTEMSFAFRCSDQDWNADYTERTIKEVNIHRGDVSIVTNGASPTTSVLLRSEQLAKELRDLGDEAFVAAFLEWRDFSLLPLAERAGKALSAASMEVLTRVLGLVSDADDAVDEAQPLLADLMGVPNPDDDEATESVEEEAGEAEGTERAQDDGSTPVRLVVYDRVLEGRLRLRAREARGR